MAEPPPVFQFVGGRLAQAYRSFGSTVPDDLHHLQELFLAYGLNDL